MIILTIGEASRRMRCPSEIEEGWLSSHLRPGRAVPQPGVHVRIDAPPLALNLSAGDAAGPTLEPLEASVIELWHERGLDRPGYRSGQLAAFLHQLCDMLEQRAPRMDSGVRIRNEVGQATAR